MNRWGLLLAPGAGASRDQSALVAIDDRATNLGLVAHRFDFPYRRAGRKAPDKPEILLRCVGEEAAILAGEPGLAPERVFAGGRSMGGRMCSMAVAAGMPAAGLVLVSYPLHPPGRRDRLRTEHFPQLKLPCLFVSGTRDNFGAPEELEAAVGAIPGPLSLHWVEGGDHGLRGKDAVVAGVVADWLALQLAAPSGRRARPARSAPKGAQGA